jgi:unsaturated rhamnogalacturonyl hydrolase
LKAYRTMMKALLRFQDERGMWHQLIDHPDAWPETSSTAMFTFAMVTGVKHGWLDSKTYAPAARKAWLGLLAYLEPDGDLREVCEGTGKENDVQYYLDRRRIAGDLHGQAPLLWCASAFLR